MHKQLICNRRKPSAKAIPWRGRRVEIQKNFLLKSPCSCIAQVLVCFATGEAPAPRNPVSIVRVAALLTTGNVVSVGRQPYKVLLVDVTLEGAQAVRLPYVPQLQLTVC